MAVRDLTPDDVAFEQGFYTAFNDEDNGWAFKLTGSGGTWDPRRWSTIDMAATAAHQEIDGEHSQGNHAGRRVAGCSRCDYSKMVSDTRDLLGLEHPLACGHLASDLPKNHPELGICHEANRVDAQRLKDGLVRWLSASYRGQQIGFDVTGADDERTALATLRDPKGPSTVSLVEIVIRHTRPGDLPPQSEHLPWLLVRTGAAEPRRASWHRTFEAACNVALIDLATDAVSRIAYDESDRR